MPLVSIKTQKRYTYTKEEIIKELNKTISPKIPEKASLFVSVLGDTIQFQWEEQLVGEP